MNDLTAWRSMFLVLSRSTERAISAIIDAQVMCEELFLASTDAEDPDVDKVLTDTKLRMVEARGAVQNAREAIKKAKMASYEEHLKY